MDETIAAISTAVGEGGIAIVRVSGANALAVADRLFVSKRGKPSAFNSHTIHFGTIGNNGAQVDQVMLTVMRAPRTYTGEDVVEINCHGGLLTARKILALCLQNGARLAEPGEFTKRAFLNGRLDLTQAEAVMDLIHSKTDRAHTAAVHALEGHLSAKVNALRDQLVTILAHIEAHIDFPEDDIAPATREKLLGQVQLIARDLDALLQTAREGRVLREGILVAIVGRPNVGKSSLMNALLGQDRAIVTPIPGTTRDTIEEYVSIAGIPFRLTDTAGIRKARGKVEQIGVERSRASAARSEIILHVLDSSRPFARADAEIAAHYAGKQTILVLNKSDLRRQLTLPKALGNSPKVEVSATLGSGTEKLRELMAELVMGGKVGRSELDVAINERHADAIRITINTLTILGKEANTGASLEVIAQQLHVALDALGEIVGKTTTEDILTKIFSTFCIGK